MTPHSELLVVSGPDAGRRLILSSTNRWIIGRAPECDFQLNDQAVSRVHCMIHRKSGQVILSDAGSRWGIFVNGLKAVEQIVRPGDKILLGETEFLVIATRGSTQETQFPHSEESSTQALFQPATSSPIERRHREANRFGALSVISGPLASDVQILQLVGKFYANYQIHSTMATTRTGTIFRGTNTLNRQQVAVKVYWPHLFTDDKSLARFLRSMEHAIPLTHEHIVHVLDAGRHRGTCFTVSELVEGESVAQLIARIGICGMLDWRRVLKIALEVTRALVYAERHGIVHRNITPHNLLIRTRDDLVKLNDLMLASAFSVMNLAELASSDQTQEQLVFMSPEQLAGNGFVDGRSDQYGLGASLYAMLTGRPPLVGHDREATIRLIQMQTPDPPTKFHLAISPLFQGEVLQMLSKRPEDRHPNPASLLRDLERVARYENVDL